MKTPDFKQVTEGVLKKLNYNVDQAAEIFETRIKNRFEIEYRCQGDFTIALVHKLATVDMSEIYVGVSKFNRNDPNFIPLRGRALALSRALYELFSHSADLLRADTLKPSPVVKRPSGPLGPDLKMLEPKVVLSGHQDMDSGIPF